MGKWRKEAKNEVSDIGGACREEYARTRFLPPARRPGGYRSVGGGCGDQFHPGECLDEDGKLMVLPTVERMIRTMPVEEICS